MAKRKTARTSTIGSWLDLARTAADCASGKWIFRGAIVTSQGKVAELRPSAGRVGSQKGAARKLPHDTRHEKLALEEFIRQARPHIRHTPATLLEWLAIAQHHGMSTRLLDWTESILVAAYFATREGSAAAGLILGLEGLREVSKRDERNPFAARQPRLYRPPHITPRIPALRSVMTLHPRPTEVFQPAGLRRWRIASGACEEIKHILDVCGINESSLFTDLDGLSRYLGWRYKWGRMHAQQLRT